VWRTLRRIEVVSGLPTVDDDAIVAAFLFYFHERYLPNQEKSGESVGIRSQAESYFELQLNAVAHVSTPSV